jgi:hypothetical protein
LKHRILNLLILTLLFLASTLLFAQEEPEITPVPPEQQQQVMAVFEMLYSGNPEVVDYIFWEDLYINNEDITLLYYDSMDGGFEDVFFNMVVRELAAELQNPDDASDLYTEWLFEGRDGEIYAYSHNNKKQVEMWFTTPGEEPMYLLEMNIADR